MADRIIALLKDVAKAAKGDLDAAMDVVQAMARGADGVQGTADDLVSPETAATLRALLETGIVTALVREFTPRATAARCFACFHDAHQR